jgi:putative nucleotidyltransferase with HDIG domain
MTKELQEATKIIKTLQGAGHYALIVGGYNRDVFIGVKPKDIDLVTSATPDQVEALFEDTFPKGKAFGVIVVNKDYEICTFREDDYNSKEFKVELLDPKTHTLEELISKDSFKRDLSINSIYYDPIADKYYDPQNGRHDIKEGVIRFVGDMNIRLEEDPVRLLRFFRFGIKYAHMNLNWEDYDLTGDKGYLLKRVSKERIFEEMTKILMNLNTWNYGDFKDVLYALKEILPDLYEMVNVRQPPLHHSEGNVGIHTFYALKSLRVKTPVTVWSTLLHDLGKVKDTKIAEDGKITSHGHDATGAIMAEELLRDLKCSNKFIEEVCYIVKNHMRIKESPKMKKSKVIKLVKNEYYENLLEVSCSDSMGAKGDITWHTWLREFEKSDRCPDGPLVKPLVTGRDLIDKGMEPGVSFKILLKKAFDLQLESELLTKQEIMLALFA